MGDTTVLYYGAMETKLCKGCEQVKPVNDFYPLPYGGAGYRSPCKACMKAKRRALYVAGTTRRSRDGVYEQVLKRDYGITLAEYNALLRKQANRCAICHGFQTARVRKGGSEMKRLSVDHDHATGAVRGLLCHRCNILVWALEDNHTTLDAIRRYIEEFRETFANGPPL